MWSSERIRNRGPPRGQHRCPGRAQPGPGRRARPPSFSRPCPSPAPATGGDGLIPLVVLLQDDHDPLPALAARLGRPIALWPIAVDAEHEHGVAWGAGPEAFRGALRRSCGKDCRGEAEVEAAEDPAGAPPLLRYVCARPGLQECSLPGARVLRALGEGVTGVRWGPAVYRPSGGVLEIEVVAGDGPTEARLDRTAREGAPEAVGLRFERRPADHVARSRLDADSLDTVAQAFASGYYDSPRRTTVRELAEELGLSPTAVHERMRRGESRAVRALWDALRGSGS